MSEPTYIDDRSPEELRDVYYECIDLERIPRERWEQVLAPRHRSERMWMALQVRDPQLRELASTLAFELDMAECQRANARMEARGRALRRTAAPLPAPGAGHVTAQPTVQVNIRLRPDDHARLTEAARTVGLKPTTLARALVLNGAAQVLRDNAETG